MPMADFKGKVVLVVNLVQPLRLHPQFTALEVLYEKYKDRVFVIVGFPANNFGGREPGTNEEIKTFGSRRVHRYISSVRQGVRERC
jgi:glutathione peroxidase